MPSEKPYRPCVVGIFVQGETVLVAQRSGLKGGAWQFPQGGVEEGETHEQALYREIKEELGCNEFEVVAEYPQLLAYDFPADMPAKIAKTYRGQIQKWFICRYLSGKGPDLSLATDKEFSAFKWVPAPEALQDAIYWKKQVYTEVLSYFKLV